MQQTSVRHAAVQVFDRAHPGAPAGKRNDDREHEHATINDQTRFATELRNQPWWNRCGRLFRRDDRHDDHPGPRRIEEPGAPRRRCPRLPSTLPTHPQLFSARIRPRSLEIVRRWPPRGVRPRRLRSTPPTHFGAEAECPGALGLRGASARKLQAAAARPPHGPWKARSIVGPATSFPKPWSEVKGLPLIRTGRSTLLTPPWGRRCDARPAR